MAGGSEIEHSRCDRQAAKPVSAGRDRALARSGTSSVRMRPVSYAITRTTLRPRPDPLRSVRPVAIASGGSEVLSTFLDAVSAVMAEQKRETIDAMDVRAGDAGLDVGCGTGDEVRLIAERVGPSGRAVGVDVNEGLLATARERRPGDLEVLFLLADAQALPFADGEFAAARVERALQHMADPSGAIAEMARVVRPGGRVVALEPDWETLVISSRNDRTTRQSATISSRGL